MRRGAAAVVAGVVIGLAWGHGLQCAAARVELGPAVQVHPAIRALDAGRWRD